MDADLKSKLDQLVGAHDVLLFMKGRRNFPQCGFSATVVQILNGLVDDYETVNVLDDPEIRQGIKDYSNWPTIPQLYVRGELVGGCDIIREMYTGGDLHALLGVKIESVEPPQVTVTDAAAEALREAISGARPGDAVHVSIDPHFQSGLDLGPKGATDVAVEINGITLLFDVASAKRAGGLTIDFQTSAMGRGFKIDNPNAPADPQ